MGKFRQNSQIGFTLTELLISLLIIGELATFTIPKIITSQQNNTYNAKAKEALASVAAAYQQAKLSGNISASTTVGALTQYLNYVSTNTSNQLIDDTYTFNETNCTSTFPCIILHSGAVLWYDTTESFGGTNTTNALWFYIDPDGKYSGTSNGPGKSINMWIYYNGRVTSFDKASPTPCTNVGCYAPSGDQDPPWFSW